MEFFISLLRSLMHIIAVPMHKPVMYGSFHIGLTALLFTLSLYTGYAMRNRTDGERLRVMSAAGWIMLVSEIIKQLFLFFIIENEQYNWWWFPFQLCSMPMYLCILLPHMKKNRDMVTAFLCTYGLLAAVCALAYPQDMLREYVFLTCHAFLWHGAMLMIAFVLLFGHMVCFENKAFLKAFLLFLFLACIAECINVYGYHHTVIPGTYPNMFYITPYYGNTQPVFRNIAESCGIMPANIIYLLAASAGSYLIFLAERIFR